MKKFLLKRSFYFLLSTTLLTLSMNAQKYSNEWISFKQKYYKIKVANDGIYRIDSAALASSGIPVGAGGVNPKNFQVYNKGVQQYIYIRGESDGVFNNGDYIEFYGKHNDGTYDSSLYINISFLPNPYYSLFNDTAVYFLTWNTSTTNNRMTSYRNSYFGNPSVYQSPWFTCTSINVPAQALYDGATTYTGSEINDPQYTASEGYFGSAISATGTTSALYTLSTKNAYTGPGAPNVFCTMAYFGASQAGGCGSSYGIGCPVASADHNISCTWTGATSNNPLFDTLFYGYAAIRRTTSTISPSQLGTTSTSFTFSSSTSSIPNGSLGTIALSYISLSYPHTYNLENATSFVMYIPAPTTLGDTTLLGITGFTLAGGDTARLYDLSNHLRTEAVNNGTSYQAFLPYKSSLSRQCFMTGDALVNQVSKLSPVGPYGGTPGMFTDFYTTYGKPSGSPVDSAYLIVTHPLLWSSVTGPSGYVSYRETTAVGQSRSTKKSRVIVADINELYDQFAYGIVKDPLSIRNFAHFTLDNFSSPPQFLFLIGKSIHGYLCRGGGANYKDDLVPTIGEPPCDIMFTSYLDTFKIEPAIATSRLSAKSNTDVMNYLQKVEQYETQTVETPPHNAAPGWTKRVLHFAGGDDAAENYEYQGFLNGYKSIIQNPFFGANVLTFSKSTSAPISINTSDSLTALINSGVSLMTFFGHSSGSSWDEGIASPTTYMNTNLYPFIISDGCYAGDIHQDYNTISLSTNSEQFTLAQEKGTVEFLASSSLAYDNVLNTYTTALYTNFSNTLYGHPFGKCIQASLKNLSSTASSDINSKCGFLAMTLEGDPGVVLNSPLEPDYTLATADITFNTQSNPSAFYVIVTEHNIGEAINKLYTVQLQRTYPNNQVKIYPLRVKYAPLNQDTLIFQIPYDPTKDPGINKFTVSLDALDQLPELNKNNNTASANLEILGNSIIPVYPYNDAIVPSPNVTLKASTINPFNAKLIRYRFQMDTTDKYNSPVLDTFSVVSPGGVIQWTPPIKITNKDSVVYFWRVCADDTTNWREFSFQSIKGKRGWGQAHFFQYKIDGYQYVAYNKPQRLFKFVDNKLSVYAQTGLYTYLQHQNGFFAFPQYNINGNVGSEEMCDLSTYTFVLINPVTGQALTHSYVNTVEGEMRGPYNCLYCGYAGDNSNETRIWPTFEYEGVDNFHKGSYIKSLIDFAATPGTYVLCYTQNYHPFSTGVGDSAVFQAFLEIGADLRSKKYNQPNLPLIVFGRKGARPGTANITIGAADTVTISQSDSMTVNWNSGYVLSPVIGPALSWDSLFWREKDLVQGDSIRLGIIGIKNNGTVDTLVGSLTINGLPRDSSRISLRHYVNPVIYPNIQLIVYENANNTINLIPSQMKRWQVLYTPVPELAVNELASSSKSYYVKKDTVAEGDTLKFAYPIQNISDYNFSGNLILSSWIQDSKGIPHYLPDRYLKKPLLAGNVVMDSLKVSTIGYPNLNSLYVEVNEPGKPRSQPEQYYFNNIASINFSVSPDKTNPLLDVTFDGIHILNQDIVSSKPNIVIRLRDENKYLALNDPSDFQIFIQPPGGAQVQVPYGQQLSFIPAVLPNNSCVLNYTPSFTQDGIYQLTVQAKDRSGNLSGNAYTIQFEVITQSMITQVMNYPNPFSSITRFVFTLTGSELPDYFKIQIINVTGKVVRELNKEDLGPIHIGRNITQYGWDGRDQYGNLVGNGVYLYHIQTRLNGSSIETMASGADEYITSGFGKMYLIR